MGPEQTYDRGAAAADELQRSKAKTPDIFLQTLEDDWRKAKLEQLRDILADEATELEEVMSYGMLGYRARGEILCHLNVQKAYVSLYVGNIESIDPDGALLDGLSLGKGCIRFRKSDSVGESGVREFVRRAMQLWRSGETLSCD